MTNDIGLGRLLVDSGVLPEHALQSALAEQQRLAAAGKKARLGEILISGKLVTPKQIQDVLARQSKTIAVCDTCGSRFNIVALQPGRSYRCQKCGGELIPADSPANVSVSGSAFMPSVSDVSGPPEVQKALEAARRGTGKRVGNMVLVRELGRGGMGVVYQGYQEDLRRTVAVKMLLQSDDAKLKARFLREARVVSKLRHPNIVGVHDLGESDGKAYFTMDCIEGGPLNCLFAPNRLPERELLGMVATIARALEYAHRQGLVHRDIKPQNILVTQDGTPFLTDFGLAREVESNTRLTMSGAVMGTPAYMSPEQARGGGDRLDHRTDIYSLGAVLYEGLTGQTPFDAADLVALLERIVREEPAAPSSRARGIPAAVDTICLKALEKQPARRYQNAAEMADDIERFLRGEDIVAKPAGAVEKGVRWLKQRPLVAVGAGAAALLLAAVTGVVWTGSATAARRQKEHNEELARLERERRDADERAKAGQAEFERKLKEMEDRLAAAKTDEERERIRKEMEAATGGGTVKDPDPVVEEKPEWPEIEQKLAAHRAAKADDLGGAIALLEAWNAKLPADAAKKSEALKDARAALDGAWKAIEAEARALESSGRWDEAVEAWRSAAKLNAPEVTARAESAVSEIRGKTGPDARAAQRQELSRAALEAVRQCRERRYGEAQAALAALRPGMPAVWSDVDAASATIGALAEMKPAIENALSTIRNFPVRIVKGGFAGKIEGADREKVRIRLDVGGETSSEWWEIDLEDVLSFWRKGGAAELPLALHAWIATFESADEKERAARRSRLMTEAARDQLFHAAVTAFVELVEAASDVAKPPVDPDPTPIASDPPVDPPVDEGRIFVVEPMKDRFGQRWAYDGSAAHQLRDWPCAPVDPRPSRIGWGISQADGKFRLIGVQTGFIVGLEANGWIAADVDGVDPPDAPWGLSWAGYTLTVDRDMTLSLSSPSRKPIRSFNVEPIMKSGPARLEIRCDNGSLSILLNGKAVGASVPASEAPAGPTGLWAAPEVTVSCDRLEIAGRVSRVFMTECRAFRDYLANAEERFKPEKHIKLPVEGGPWKSGDGRVVPVEKGALVVRAPGNGPENIARVWLEGVRNWRVRFHYRLEGGTLFQVVLRDGPERLSYWLPTDAHGEWRSVEITAIETAAWGLVDGAIAVMPQQEPKGAAAGEFAFEAIASEIHVKDVEYDWFKDAREGDGPRFPWKVGAGGGGPGPGPGPEPGWIDMFDGKTSERFRQNAKLKVVGGTLNVAGDLETLETWVDIEIEAEFTSTNTGKLQVGLRGEWVAKATVAKGPGTLVARAQRDVIEVFLNGEKLKTDKRPPGAGPFKLQVDGTVLRIKSIRNRGPGAPGPGPGPDGPRGPPK